MPWELITNIILIAAFAVLAVFAVVGLVQLIIRKAPTDRVPTPGRSLRKVDPQILFMPIPLALAAVAYFLFDKLIILNTRPIDPDDPSFPSSHVMFAATIFFTTMFALPRYIKNKPFRIILDILMAALVLITAIGRVAARLHWLSDVAAGAIFAGIFALVYYIILQRKEPLDE